MEDEHRKRIIDNMDNLIRYTEFEALTNACLHYDLLSYVMLENIKRVTPLETGELLTDERKQRERHRKLFIKITKRGPQAYEKLRDIFVALKYGTALELLSNDDSYVSIRNTRLQIPTTATSTAIVGEVNATATAEEVNTTTQERETIRLGEDLRDGEQERFRYDRKDSCASTSDEAILEEFVGDISPKEKFDIMKSKEIQKHPILDTYRMESKDNRGVFFMVNMIDFRNKNDRRQGAHEDAQSLLYLFKKLGFKLFAYTNISQDDFFRLLEELLKSDYTKKTECFVMALMTHGSMDENVQRVEFSDGSVAKVDDIEKHFHHHVCGNLVNKPKIFLYPFCRGDRQEHGVPITNIQTDSISYNAELSDVLICFATSQGYKSHRDPEEGSWYIQEFVKIMAHHAHITTFEDMLKMIQTATSKLRTSEGHLQTGNYVNKGFNKALYFNPGIP